MKLHKLLGFMMASTFILGACGSDSSNDESESNSTETAETTDSTSDDSDSAETSDKGTRSNPYSVGETAEFAVTYYDDNDEMIDGKLKLTINDVTTGEEANEFIMSENEYNEPAPEGYQFAILDSTAELVEGSDDAQLDLYLTQEVFDSEGQSVVLDDASVSTGNRLSEQSLFPGASADGYIIPPVPDDLEGVVVKMQYIGGGDSVWFKLN